MRQYDSQYLDIRARTLENEGWKVGEDGAGGFRTREVIRRWVMVLPVPAMTITDAAADVNNRSSVWTHPHTWVPKVEA